MQTRPATSQALYYESPMNDSGIAQYAYTPYDDTCMTDMSTTSAWSSGSYIPTPFNSKHTKRKSSGNLLSRSKSVLFSPSTWSSGKQAAGSLDDESTYCHLSEDGIEVLANASGGDKSVAGKRMKRAGSLSNMLKTPSRLALRKSNSKLRLFDRETRKSSGLDTPASASSMAFNLDRELPPLPPLPSSAPSMPVLSSATPASGKSTKSLFARAVLRDKGNKAPVQPDSSLSSPSETLAAAPSLGKTPKQNWLGRLNIGRSSTQKKVRLEIPSFEPRVSSVTAEKAASAWSMRDEQGQSYD